MVVFYKDLWNQSDSGFKNVFPKIYTDITKTTEVVYSNSETLSQYKDTSILLVGGGPSTNTLESFNGYDAIWSMSHFFLHPALAETKVDVAMLSLEVNLESKQLHIYLNKFQPLVGFEWNTNFLKKRDYIQNEFYDRDKMFCAHTRFYSKLGYGVRMMILAASLGVKQISFIGLDGPKPILEGQHAFQPGKKTLPSSITSANAHSIFKEQYKQYWEYMLETFPNTKFVSLDKNNMYHELIR